MMISKVSLAVLLSNSSRVLPDAHVAAAYSRTENIAVTMLVGAALERWAARAKRMVVAQSAKSFLPS